jgi:hypothetical protein
MITFDEYLKRVVEYEEKELDKNFSDRERLMIYSGANLNWQGDFLGNPKIKYKKITVPVEKILLTGTEPKWNKILVDECNRSVTIFKERISKDKKLKEMFERESSYRDFPILLRGPYDGYYKILDGMYRFVGKVVKGEKEAEGFVSVNGDEVLPFCEPHVVYDLIRGYERNFKNRNGEDGLYQSLLFLSKIYGNVEALLRERFDPDHIMDKDTNRVIKRVLKDIKKV